MHKWHIFAHFKIGRFTFLCLSFVKKYPPLIQSPDGSLRIRKDLVIYLGSSSDPRGPKILDVFFSISEWANPLLFCDFGNCLTCENQTYLYFCMLFCTGIFLHLIWPTKKYKKDIFRISTSHFDRFVAVDNLEKTVSTKIRQIVTV